MRWTTARPPRRRFRRERANGRRAAAIVVVADHGEGLGDHGESQHGDLLYQSTMHVPLVDCSRQALAAGASDTPVSTRRVYHTMLSWAGLGVGNSLLDAGSQPRRRDGAAGSVLGEAMKPFLEYGWQPQVMSVVAPYKAIVAGKVETYDISADPARGAQSGRWRELSGAARAALDDYPVPSPDGAQGAAEPGRGRPPATGKPGIRRARAPHRSCGRTRPVRPTWSA